MAITFQNGKIGSSYLPQPVSRPSYKPVYQPQAYDARTGRAVSPMQQSTLGANTVNANNQQSGQGGSPIWDDNVRNASNGQPAFDPYQEQLNREIENAYSGGMDVLNQNENWLRSYQPQYEQQIQNDYSQNLSDLGGQRQSSLDRFSLQDTQAQGRKESALAAARRSYQEQQMGAQQRFGGSSSAGGAMSELLARSQAEQQGQTMRQYNDYAQNLEIQRNELERNYNIGSEKLRLEKERNILNAQNEFQSKLLQISSDKAMLGQAKSQARLQALQDLRNKQFQIESEQRDFQNRLALQKIQSQQALSAYAQQASGIGAYADQLFNNATNNMNTNPAPLPVSNTSQMNPLQYIGSWFGQKDDEYK